MRIWKTDILLLHIAMVIIREPELFLPREQVCKVILRMRFPPIICLWRINIMPMDNITNTVRRRTERLLTEKILQYMNS